MTEIITLSIIYFMSVTLVVSDIQKSRTIIRIVNSIQVKEGCWIWQKLLDKHGYGQSFIFIDGTSRTIRAHRLSYQIFNGPIPDNLVLDHLCRRPSCVNPEHLEPVTQKENTSRGAGSWANRPKWSKTHCKQGHEFTPLNTRYSKDTRICITCASLANKAYRKKKRKKDGTT